MLSSSKRDPDWGGGGCCETHWLDSEPTPFDEGYEEYCKRQLEIEKRDVGFYRGFFVPPTQREHEHTSAELARRSYQNIWGNLGED
jgi:hypothetical protein